jgi:transcriptional regulator with XRE-family HTH domain
MDFKIFLTETRKTKRVSKYRLSKDTGIRITTITKYERGEIVPSITNAEKLCAALGTSFTIGKDQR